MGSREGTPGRRGRGTFRRSAPGGGQRRRVPGAEGVGERPHDDGRDRAADDDVDDEEPAVLEEEGQPDPSEDAVETEQAVTDQGAVRPQEVGRQRAGLQAENPSPPSFPELTKMPARKIRPVIGSFWNIAWPVPRGRFRRPRSRGWPPPAGSCGRRASWCGRRHRAALLLAGHPAQWDRAEMPGSSHGLTMSLRTTGCRRQSRVGRRWVVERRMASSGVGSATASSTGGCSRCVGVP
jgi:hypothetical protein